MSDSRKTLARRAALVVFAENDVDDYAAGRGADALVQGLERVPTHAERWRLVRDGLDLTAYQATRWLEHCGYKQERAGARA